MVRVHVQRSRAGLERGDEREGVGRRSGVAWPSERPKGSGIRGAGVSTRPPAVSAVTSVKGWCGLAIREEAVHVALGRREASA